MKVFGMCINKNVVAGLAVVGLGIWWMVPEAIGAALPFLLIAICPLSMVFMMKAMDGMGQGQGGQQPSVDLQTTGAPAAVAAGSSTESRAGGASVPAPVVGTDPRARWN